MEKEVRGRNLILLFAHPHIQSITKFYVISLPSLPWRATASMHDDLCKLEKDTPSSSRLNPVPGLNGQQVRLWLNCNPHSHPWLEALAQ